MTDLQRGKSFVTVTGKVKITDRTFSGEMISERSGYKYSRVNLGVETSEGNVVYMELMGGYSPSNPVIYTQSKEDNKSMTVNFADRNKEEIIDSVADYKLYKVGLERDGNGKLIVKKFLSPMDVHDYLQEHLKDGMEVTVRGSFSFSEYKGETQRKINIQSIFLPYQKKNDDGSLQPVNYRASFVQTILLNEDSFKKITKEDAKEGEVVVSAFAVDYVGKKDGKEIKKNLPFTVPITVKINKEKPELTSKILDKLFKVKKGKVRELTIEGEIIEGYEKQDISNADIELSDDIKELIELGLYSEEEAKQKMVVRGNKVSKLVFTRPYIKKTDDKPNGTLELDDEKYTADDLYVQIDNEEESSGDDILAGVEESGSDDSWLDALGLGE